MPFVKQMARGVCHRAPWSALTQVPTRPGVPLFSNLWLCVVKLMNDTGANTTDMVTKTVRSTLVGQAPAGYTVVVSTQDGVTVTDSAVVAADGSFALQLSSPLSEGRHVLDLVTRDISDLAAPSSPVLVALVVGKHCSLVETASLTSGADMTAPFIVSLTLTSGGLDSYIAGLSSTLTVSLTVSEPLDVAPTMRLLPASCPAQNSQCHIHVESTAGLQGPSATWQGVYKMSSAVRDGPIGVHVEYTDVAGNTGAAWDTVMLLVDDFSSPGRYNTLTVNSLGLETGTGSNNGAQVSSLVDTVGQLAIMHTGNPPGDFWWWYTRVLPLNCPVEVRHRNGASGFLFCFQFVSCSCLTGITAANAVRWCIAACEARRG
mgnify:CR=1 FL=1